MYIQFDFNPAKSRTNIREHGVSFEEAITSFYDLNARSEPDAEHSHTGDERFINIGMSSRGRLLFVVHNEVNGLISLISARVASPTQRKLYEES